MCLLSASFVSPCPLFLGNHEISSISQVTMSPSRQNSLMSIYSLPLARTSYNVISAFCTEDNIPQCISYINQVLQCQYLVSTLSVLWPLCLCRDAPHKTPGHWRGSAFFYRSLPLWASPPNVLGPAHQGEPHWTRCQPWMPCTSCCRFSDATGAMWRSSRKSSWRTPAHWSLCTPVTPGSRYERWRSVRAGFSLD